MLPSSSVHFCISTCRRFAAYTLPIIIPSLTRAGIGTSEILIVNGGQEDWRIDHYGDVPMICTPQNSFEYTPLIEIVEHSLVSPHWFLLHDTCIAGPSFKKLVYEPPSDYKKVAMKHSPSMSIGLYNMDYLMRHKDRLTAIKNMDSSPGALQAWKQWGVPNEDYMLWKLQDSPTGLYHPDKHGPDEWNYQGHSDVYGTGLPRRIEYFPQLDLFKAKSNWQGVQPTLCLDI